jgi:hypothetical protein
MSVVTGSGDLHAGFCQLAAQVDNTYGPIRARAS